MINISEKNLGIEIEISIGDNYNDFHSKTFFNIKILNDYRILEAQAQIIFQDRIDADSVNSHKEILERAFDFDLVYSSWGGVEEYKNILEFLGEDLFDKFLFYVNDVCYLSFNSIEFPKNDLLYKTLLRRESNYYVFKNFEEIYIDNNYIVPEILFLEEEDNFSEFIFKISSIGFNKNIVGIIGVNGIGKSYTLRRIAEKYSDNNCFYKIIGISTTREGDSTFNGININNRKFKFINSNLINDKSIANVVYDIGRLGREKFNAFEEFYRFVLDFKKILFEDEDGVDYNLNNLIDGGELSILLKNRFSQRLKLKIYDNNDNYREASSGEITCLKIIAGIISSIRNDSLLLIDEIENHLHPNFITRIIFLISKILIKYNSYAVLATHSPYVVREMVSSNVFVMDLGGMSNKINYKNPVFNTLGENLQKLSNFIFNDELSSVILSEYIKNGGDLNSINELSNYAKIIINSEK